MFCRRDIQTGFTHPITPKSIGGLILCAMDERPGVAEFDGYATKLIPQAPYFSHAMNKSQFQATLKDWFSLWQHPLDSEEPTKLDWAIIHTDLFVDTSDRFGDMGRTVQRQLYFPSSDN